jgi:hypothetical protein
MQDILRIFFVDLMAGTFDIRDTMHDTLRILFVDLMAGTPLLNVV